MAHFGWTWDYLHNGIAWGVVQRMMADLPWYDFDGDKDDEEDVKLTSDNAQGIMNYINMMS